MFNTIIHTAQEGMEGSQIDGCAKNLPDRMESKAAEHLT
jgi:hypothetical protein